VIAIEVNGNIQALKESVLIELEKLYDMQLDEEFVPKELAEKMAELSSRINREIAVYLDRKGNVMDVSVGDSKTVSLGEIESRRDTDRLSGIRCIHTHPNGDGILSSVDINSLINMKMDAIVALGVKDGKVISVYAALPQKNDEGRFTQAEIFGPYRLGAQEIDTLYRLVKERDTAERIPVAVTEQRGERAILVALETYSGDVIDGKTEGQRSLDELEELAKAAGVCVVEKILQKRPAIDTAYYIGRGKIEELSLLRQSLDANLIIFDDELSGAQVRNIEEATGTKVIDRTTLILDIFASRAKSKEGKIQVELAQLKYRLPRIIGFGTDLSRLGGGIGTRGPGEKKLEVDRRHIRRRINMLESELKEISKRRSLVRENRKKNLLPTIALVGYTNVGKSTLMNKLCNTDVYAENMLFATLDPSVRGLKLPDGRDALMVDTVGFIRKLPHELVESFKSTLEEVVYADVIMYVVDISSSEADDQIKVVDGLLKELGADKKPIIYVLNKVDLKKSDQRPMIDIKSHNVYEISAVTGQGLDELLKGVESVLPAYEVEADFQIPYSEGWALSYIHDRGKISQKEYNENGTRLKAVMRKSDIKSVESFLIEA